MRATLILAGAALAVLAVVSLVMILAVEPSPPPPAREQAAVPPEVTAAVAAAKETAVKEAAAKQAAAEEAARETAAKEAAARHAAEAAAAREAAAKEAAAKEAAGKEAKESAKEADADGGSGRATGAVVAREGEPGQAAAREMRAPSRPHDGRSSATISARLEELKPRLAQCYERARGAGTAPSERPVPPVFVLEIEGAGEQYRVVDADVDSRGNAEDAVLECMQSVLLSATFTTPGVEATERVALRFSP